MEKWDFYRRLFTICLGFALPIVILIVCGQIISISSSWNTCLQPIFIFVNALTSYFFFDAHRWRISSFFLLALTAFSVASFPNVHNIIATMFFVSCFRPLYMLKRFRFYTWIYLLGVPVGLFFGLFWGEVFGLYVLCIYHVHVVVHMYRLGVKRRHQLKD